jgi:hypothetical protein
MSDFETPESAIRKIMEMDADTPRKMLDKMHALQVASQLLQDAGQLVWRHQVEATTAAVWEMVANDLRHTLPSEVADRMPNAAIAAKVRRAVKDSVELCIESWRKAGCDIENEGTETKAQTAKRKPSAKKRRD